MNPKLPTWNGEWKSFSDYKLAVELEADGQKPDDLPYLAPRLVRNLTSRAWEACVDIDREKLKAEKGYQYLLQYLRDKRGKQHVDQLGDALGKYFQSGEAYRREGENLADYDLRHSALLRDMTKAMKEVGASNTVPSEIFGWFVLNQYLRLDPSDAATVKSTANSYKIEDVMAALRRMWGGESLAEKDLEKKRRAGSAKTYLATPEPEGGDGAIWASASPEDENEDLNDENPDELQAWFDDSLEAYLARPEDEEVFANFQEVRNRFANARKSLDRARTGRGFYPNNKGSGKSGAKGSGSSREGTFPGRCMRCGKYGHKAMHCRQQGKGSEPSSGSGSGHNVGFVFMNALTTKVPVKLAWQEFMFPKDVEIAPSQDVAMAWMVAMSSTSEPPASAYAVLCQQGEQKAILDSGASESIVGAITLQGIYDHFSYLGFDPEAEVKVDRNVNKSFIFGNNQTSAALGLAKMSAGICGEERQLDVHVVDGATPLLLSGKWLYDAGAVINFKTGRAIFTEISPREIQLERAPSFHLMMPVTAFHGNQDILDNLFVQDGEDPGVAQLKDSSPRGEVHAVGSGTAEQTC